MLGVTAGGPGLVAVGVGSVSASGVAQVWISSDGLSWTQVTHDNRDEMYGFMWDATVFGPGLIAIGCCEEPAPVWTSADGLSWSPAPDVLFARPGE